MTAPWKPGDLPKPGSREYTRQLAEVFRQVTAGKVTVYPPEQSRSDEWSFWADDEDVTGEVLELLQAKLLCEFWTSLSPTPRGSLWLAEVA